MRAAANLHALPRSGGAFTLLLVILVFAGLAVWLCIRPALQRERLRENCRSAFSVIHHLSRLEAEARSRDLDGNGKADYWAGDVAGLLALTPENSPASTSVSPFYHQLPGAYADIARADPSRPDAEPYKGYWFVPIDLDVDGKPFRANGNPWHPTSFGFCAYPAEVGVTGNHTFITNEGGTVFMSPSVWVLRARRWPADLELRSRWSKPG